MISPLDLCDLRTRVQAAVDAEMQVQRAVLAPVGDELGPLVDAVERLIAGGKRLRAGFLYWGYRASGRPDSDALVRLAAAMEFFQAAALLHDDVMDGSDTRRGMPAAHRAFAGSTPTPAGPVTAPGSGSPRRSSPATSASSGRTSCMRRRDCRATSWTAAGGPSTRCAPS